MMRRLLPLIVMMILSMQLYAQQDPLYAQYFNNPMLINPAVAGSMEKLFAGIAYRTQWTGVEGAPSTFNFNSHLSLLDSKVGVGVVVLQDQLGEYRNQQYKGVASYRIKLSQSTFSFGMQFGVNRYTNNLSEVRVMNPDPLFAPISESSFNTGAGMLLKSDRYTLGISVPQLLNSRNYYLFGQYRMLITENLDFNPSTLVRMTKGVSPSVDLNANVTLKRLYTAGVFTRNLNTYGLLLQLVARNLRVGYMFELPGKSSALNFNSHEISLGISLGILKEHDQSDFGF